MRFFHNSKGNIILQIFYQFYSIEITCIFNTCSYISFSIRKALSPFVPERYSGAVPKAFGHTYLSISEQVLSFVNLLSAGRFDIDTPINQ